jgi:hypothetical protein
MGTRKILDDTMTNGNGNRHPKYETKNEDGHVKCKGPNKHLDISIYLYIFLSEIPESSETSENVLIVKLHKVHKYSHLIQKKKSIPIYFNKSVLF